MRFVIALALAVLSTAAQAQVVAQHLPMYRPGDYYAGVLIDQRGERSTLHQSIEMNADYRPQMTVQVEDRRGVWMEATHDVVGSTAVLFLNSKEVARVLGRACNVEFPIVMHKRYECVEYESKQGRTYEVRASAVFDQQLRENGHVVGVCSTSEQRYDGKYLRARACFTPGLKWATRLQILEYR